MKILYILLLLFANLASAQQDGMQFGAFTVFPTLGVSYGYDDNILFTNDDLLIESSNFSVISPGIRLETEGEKASLLLQYDYNKTLFSSNSNNNFEMHHGLASLGYQKSSKTRFEISAEVYDGSDRRGTRNQQGDLLRLNLDPDEWNSFGLVGKWHYGGIGAKGSVDLALGFVDKNYENNRLFTFTRDRETRFFEATYGHRVSPKTQLLAQARLTRINYDSANLDNDERRLMVGGEWEATGKTTARALVGYLTKSFRDGQSQGFTGLAAEVGLLYKVRSYSVVDITLNRETDETNGNGDFVLRNSLDIGWTHNWKKRLTTTLNAGRSDEDYRNNFRDDNFNHYGVSANYQFNEWLISGVSYRHMNRDSSFEEFGYDDNSVMLTLEVSK